MPGTLLDMTAHRHSNSKIEMATHPEDTFLFNAFNREKTHATFNTGLFWNKQPSGVTPKSLADALLSKSNVNAYALFIAEEETATQMVELMPPGRGHYIEDTSALPLVFRQLFAHSLSKL